MSMRSWERDSSSLNPPSVPTGGHQPHVSMSLPAGPSVIPLLLLLSSSNTSQHASDKHAGGKKKQIFRDIFRSDPTKWCTQQWWMTLDAVTFILEIFYDPASFFEGCRFGFFFMLSTSQNVHSSFFLPHHPPSYGQWVRGQRTQTSCPHSNTLRDKDLLIIWF